jgi:hypothetical protein
MSNGPVIIARTPGVHFLGWSQLEALVIAECPATPRPLVEEFLDQRTCYDGMFPHWAWVRAAHAMATYFRSLVARATPRDEDEPDPVPNIGRGSVVAAIRPPPEPFTASPLAAHAPPAHALEEVAAA